MEIFPISDSLAYGEAFELRNISDYEMLGAIDRDQASTTLDNARYFVERCVTYLSKEGML